MKHQTVSYIIAINQLAIIQNSEITRENKDKRIHENNKIE